MPGIHLVARETIYARGAGQMCRQDSRAQMSADEEIAAEGSLSIYCKPVELYNILQRRAIDKPLYLQRCLYYQQQAKNKRRIQMTISLSGTANNQLQTEKVFPIYIFLARPLSNVAFTENAAVYQFSRVCEVTSYIGVGEMNRSQVTFILPEMNKLSLEVESGNFDILLVSCDAISGLLSGNDITKNHTEMTSFPSIGGYGMLGKIPLKQVYLSWEDSLNLRVGERAELLTTVDMHSRVVKLSCLDKEKSISFQLPCNFGAVSTPLQVAVTISAEMVGAKEITPYNSYSYSDSHTDIPMSPVLRVRTGNVIFNYRYHNNTMQRTEVTENFTCPFCLVKCASYKGLRHHLPSSHDLFNFEFWVNEEYQAVNVSVNTDQLRSEIVADGVDPKEQTFCFCSKRFRCRKRNILVQNAKHVHPLVLDSDFPVAINEHRDKVDGPVELLERNNTSSPNATGFSSATAHSYIGPECVQSVSGSNLSPPTMLQLAKIRKLSAERSDPRNRSLLEKRLFFHSHRAQPMELEQVLSDRDSEDEVDDDVADLEDRRMLDDFVDVSKDEKQMMHLWNSFVRKQRVLADGHIPWACEAFSKLHGQELVLAPDLLWCWRLLMIKLWNHGLLDARTMNKCNVTIEQFQSQDVGESRIIAEGEPMIVAEGESDNR